jgi:hypothetical protein
MAGPPKSATAVLASDLTRFPTLHSRHIYPAHLSVAGHASVQTGLESEDGSLSAVSLACRVSSLADPSSGELCAEMAQNSVRPLDREGHNDLVAPGT